MDLHPIKLFPQEVDREIIKNICIYCYNNKCFSTFPYLIYKLTSSYDSMLKYNSGNCIALVNFLKITFEKSYNIKSYIVPASVPESFKLQNQNLISHVALVIPTGSFSFILLDPAFLMVDLMECDLKNNVKQQARYSNIYSEVNERFTYILKTTSCPYVLPNSLGCECQSINNPSDIWMYFLNEIRNPDKTIGSHYLKLKNEPFIISYYYDSNIDQIFMKFLLKILDEGKQIQIKERNKELYNGPIHKIPNKYQKQIEYNMYPYFDSYII